MDETQLRDIRGLDTFTAPPEPTLTDLVIANLANEQNHLILGVCAACLLLLIGWLLMSKNNLSWQQQAQQTLKKLSKQLNQSPNNKIIAEELSQLIRRIAMSRCGRESCAGLEGKSWLSWLQQNDPKQFQWTEKALILINLPYAPDNAHTPLDKTTFKQIIKATYPWTEQHA